MKYPKEMFIQLDDDGTGGAADTDAGSFSDGCVGRYKFVEEVEVHTEIVVTPRKKNGKVKK